MGKTSFHPTGTPSTSPFRGTHLKSPPFLVSFPPSLYRPNLWDQTSLYLITTLLTPPTVVIQKEKNIPLMFRRLWQPVSTKGQRPLGPGGHVFVPLTPGPQVSTEGATPKPTNDTGTSKYQVTTSPHYHYCPNTTMDPLLYDSTR